MGLISTRESYHKRKISFPKLMLQRGTGMIVLLESPGVGTVIFTNFITSEHSKRLGKSYDDFKEKDFIEFFGKVTLINEEELDEQQENNSS